MIDFLIGLMAIQFCLFMIITWAFYRYFKVVKSTLIKHNEDLFMINECQKLDAKIFGDFLARLNCLNDSTVSLGEFLIEKHPDDKRLFTYTENLQEKQQVTA